MAEFLLEIFCEEIPARMQQKAAADLEKIIENKLKAENLNPGAVTSYVTARRLILNIDPIDLMQPDVTEERRGPRVGAPEKAIEGFLRGAGLTREQLIEREDKKGSFLYGIINQKGRAAKDVIAEFMPDIIKNFPWPKSQRWGNGSLRWVRPIHSILCLLDGEIVDFKVGEIQSSNVTQGHRFMAKDDIKISSFAQYKEKLEQAFVMIDAGDRKQLISQNAAKLATKAGLQLVADDALLDEVVGLAEYPVVLMGGFDEEFLDVPPEALTSAMRTHQKYFSLQDENGKLANKFIFVSNIKTADNGTKIIDGNERVLRARLSDTKFFWDQDLKTRLEDHLPKLDYIIFHAKLGTVGSRVARLDLLSEFIADKIGAHINKSKLAATLSKSDLVTGMVDECPELQGLMGKYFALIENIDIDVANAIADQYSPKGPSDQCPSAPVSMVLALAEKLDTLTGFFAIDEKPTGSKDPYALRRAALGIIRLILENKLRIDLKSLMLRSIELHGIIDVDSNECLSELKNFFWDRLKIYAKDHAIRHDIIGAEFNWDLVKLIAKADALQKFIATDDGENLLVGYKRASNILKAEEKKDAIIFNSDVSEDLISLKEETDLFKALQSVADQAVLAIEKENFVEAMASLSTLRGPIDRFFDEVTVNCDEANIRINRLKLLSQIRSTMNLVVDFSKIEG